MTYNEAKKLKAGDKIIQKCHGYIMTVISTKECPCWTSGKKYIMINCSTENGSIMEENHKEVNLYKE